MLQGTPSTICNHKMSTTSLSPNSMANEVLGSEHYIHSRLRSTLPCGPKEVAGAYTGVLTGTTTNVRRMASLNAEVRTKLVYSPDYPSSAIISTGLLKSPTRSSVNGSIDLSVVSPSKISDNNHGMGENNRDHSLLPTRRPIASSFIAEQDHIGSRSMGASSKSPSSSPPKRYQHFIKDSFVEIEDIRKTSPKRKPFHSPMSPELRNSTKRANKSPGSFIKRTAAVNAEAFVHAIMGYEYSPSSSLQEFRRTTTSTANDHFSSNGMNTVLGKRASSKHTGGNSNQNNSKKKKESGSTKVPSLSQLSAHTVSRSANGPYKIVPMESLHTELAASSSNEEDESPPPYERSITEFGHSEPVAFNCLGLLYNSDTVHSRTVIYLTTEGRLPSVVIPPIIPQKLREVNLAKENLHPIRRRPRKGDNGWIAMGQSIKTIKIRSRDGGEHVERKYFIGIKRKDEELFVRDSIVVRSGKKSENPYVAKIGSIWQEKDGLVVTAFWYYRPEDVQPNISSQFHPNEVMASQHHDDIGVACIDDKCQVYGYTQYCRYRANLEASKIARALIQAKNIVPPICTQDLEGVSFAAAVTSKDTNHFAMKKAKMTADPDDDDDTANDIHHDDVYFCYRAFNHITGKIIKHSIN